MSGRLRSRPGMQTVGWREWAALPELDIPAIKVKVDTGARTSALHAFEVNTFERDGSEWVRFRLHPLQDNTEHECVCECPVIDRRVVSDSGGHREERVVISTQIEFGGRRWPIEMTLTDRDSMRFACCWDAQQWMAWWVIRALRS